MTKFKMSKEEMLEDLLKTQLLTLEKRFEKIRDGSEEARNVAVVALGEIKRYTQEIERRFKNADR
jgi:hypothetical protein